MFPCMTGPAKPLARANSASTCSLLPSANVSRKRAYVSTPTVQRSVKRSPALTRRIGLCLDCETHLTDVPETLDLLQGEPDVEAFLDCDHDLHVREGVPLGYVLGRRREDNGEILS